MGAMTIRRAIVTGATGAIGRAIAAGLVEHGLAVTVVGRDPRKTYRVADEIGAVPAIADLSRRHEVAALAEQWTGSLNVLVNNAAQCPRRRTETPEGIEAQFATNVLGYVWMMQAFGDALEAAAPARVVTKTPPACANSAPEGSWGMGTRACSVPSDATRSSAYDVALARCSTATTTLPSSSAKGAGNVDVRVRRLPNFKR